MREIRKRGDQLAAREGRGEERWTRPAELMGLTSSSSSISLFPNLCSIFLIYTNIYIYNILIYLYKNMLCVDIQIPMKSSSHIYMVVHHA